jgi:hypothetical protein
VPACSIDSCAYGANEASTQLARSAVGYVQGHDQTQLGAPHDGNPRIDITADRGILQMVEMVSKEKLFTASSRMRRRFAGTGIAQKNAPVMPSGIACFERNGSTLDMV